MTINFITGNKNKFNEIKAILPEVEQLDIDLPEIQTTDPRVIIKAKLLEALKHKKACFIVEDTSLCFDCLGGLPGPLIKWFLKAIGNQGLFEIVQKFGNPKAEARTIIGYAKNPEDIHYFEGTIKGTIIPPSGETSFGWDPIFRPDGYDKSFAEIPKDEKNSISMRRIAVDQLKEFLKT